MNQFLHFIINQQSKNSEYTFKKLVTELPKHTQNYEISVTENIDQLENLLLQLKKQLNSEDIVVIVGGDGSLNHITSLFEKYQLVNPIGYIPSGSGNDFARSYKIPLNTEQAIDHLFNVRKAQEISIIYTKQGKDEHYAVNSLGIGIDGMVIHMVNSHSGKKYLGPLIYISSIFSAFIKQKKFPITLKTDDKIKHFDHCQLVVITNNPFFGGGIQIVPKANGKDEDLNILVANDVSGKDLLNILFKLFFNKSHLSHPKLHSFISKNGALYIDSQQFGQKDGEPITQEGYAYTFSTKKRAFWI